MRSVDDGIATSGTGGCSELGLFGALARFARVLGRERTRVDISVERSRERRARPSFAGWPRPATRGMEFAPDLIEPIVGFRHWRSVEEALSSMFSMTAWQTSQMTARCTFGDHDPAHTPSSDCTCGIYAYYEPCPRTASALSRDLVGGAVVVWGESRHTPRACGLSMPVSWRWISRGFELGSGTLSHASPSNSESERSRTASSRPRPWLTAPPCQVL